MGTRFLPVTKASPKEMLPIVDKPVIQYIVEEAVASGIEEIIFVTGKGKRAIEDYFDADAEIMRALEIKRKDKELKELKKLENIAKISYVRQPHPLGDGHAILCAEHCISEGESFAVLFGDDIITHADPALLQLIRSYEQKKCSIIGVQKIEGKEIEKYGVVQAEFINGLGKVEKLQEKPKYENAVSSYGIIGKYVCTHEIFKGIVAGASSRVSPDSELRLIDGFMYLLKKESEVYTQCITGKRYDTGSKIGWLKANISFALESEELQAEMKEFLSHL
jgi:UTP--glucose-1-phosphate uridylyltransferase